MQRILVALDESPLATHVLRSAIELGRQYTAPLVLFRTVDVPHEFPPLAHTDHRDKLAAMLVQSAREALSPFAEQAKGEGLEVTVEVVASLDAGGAIVAMAAAAQADAIVIGSHGHVVGDDVIGTTTTRVVDQAGCTVFVVHSENDARPCVDCAADGDRETPYRTNGLREPSPSEARSHRLLAWLSRFVGLRQAPTVR